MTQHVVPFEELAQGGWGAPASFEASTVFSIQFQVGPSADFEFAIDNIGFY